MSALLALLLAAQDDFEALRARVEAQPAPVRSFIVRRAMCNHWSGEEPYDAGRARDIARALRALRCGRLEHDEAALRRRHAGRAETLDLLDETRETSGW